MEVVSTSNLVFSETEIQQQQQQQQLVSLPACNPCHEFLAKFFSYATWFVERSNRKLCINTNMKLFIISWWQNCEKTLTKKDVHKKLQNQNRPAISWKKFFFYFKNALFFAIIWSEQKKVDKLFLVKQQANLVKTWLGGRVEETFGGAFLLTPWLVGTKYPNQITLCDNNTVILLIIVIIIDI